MFGEIYFIFWSLWPDTFTELGFGAISYVGRSLSLVFAEIYSIVGPFAGHAGILNLFLVPFRSVWRLPGFVFGEI